ncbi:SIR2 family NAD-dependent protein deacylase [Bacillus haynesii]|uniref:SIR2 family NAD-dependent protein deacylase n=1 Tax=Bacillus haynesii TaxID=1925021 RepID=UPI00227E1AD6|nr:SIR2 family protein [Bacillus haynesii]MCY9369966.1 SIR2 family protein [Bacillus haynesii]MEC0722359.1 SIR2 family protein [Bacillus haynesii]
MDYNLVNLNRDYLEGKIVPFIGAGLSVPFKVPTWKELIKDITDKYAVGNLDFVKQSVNVLLERNDYWDAIDQIKKFINLSDQDIQSSIIEIIEEKKIEIDDDSLHNYVDIGLMDFKLYLTTNYEDLLYKYMNCETYPMLLREIDFSTQKLFDKRRVFHLHGHLSNEGSIVISRDSYQELYDDEKYNNLLKVVTSTKKLLFMGFSFDDQFIQKLIMDHREFFKGQHYILLDNPSDSKVKVLKDEFGLTTIKYNSKNSSHSKEIRKVLSVVARRNSEGDTSGNLGEEVNIEKKSNQSVIVGAKISDMDKNVEENLFYKKLQIEEITPGLIDLSSTFYVAAESYIRELKNNGVSIEIIDSLLGKVFIKYKEKYLDTYEKFGDSQQFVEVVHETLKKIDLGRRSKLFSENEVSDEDENRGLIHILADDEKRNIWWGEKRFK